MSKTKSDQFTPIESLLASLYGRINYEHQTRVTPEHFKLRNMRDILHRLGSPHVKYPVIHVAGTKGKGSVSTMLGEVLSVSGRRTGVYTSPHLESIHQRMTIDGRQITDDQLARVLTALQPIIAEMDAESKSQQSRPLTFFEITTAAAFFHFSQQQCEVVVLEVGLGGRLDSTNVCEPVACVITNISVDHTRQLGSTVDKIAFEKAGIIKPEVPVISGTLDPVAAQVIARTADENRAPIRVLNQDFKIDPARDDSRTFSYTTSPDSVRPAMEISDLKLQLIGRHQQTNAALAVATTLILNEQGWNISNNAIRTGLAKATLLGRAEVVRREPTIIIDMAHNAASIIALVDAMNTDIPQWKSCTQRKLIFATSHDKDAVAMLHPLVASFDEIILTKYQDNPRGRCERELSGIAQAIAVDLSSHGHSAATISTEPTPLAAWARLALDLQQNELVCITGSAFLVAELRPTILESGFN